MSIKDLFNKKTIVFESIASASVDAESSEFLSASVKENETFLPPIDFSTASNFVKYGSAELYYENSIKRVYQQYPYDGSLAEKTKFQLSSSALDRWIYGYKYPKTTGYVKLGENYGSSIGTVGTVAAVYGGYQNLEYIHIQGGMHTASAGMEGKPLANTFDDSVVYHTASNRTTSLKTDLVSGSTVEFWLRKPDIKTNGENEVIFDLWNGELSSSNDYGRMTIEYRTDSAAGKRFIATLRSGSNGFTRQFIGAALPVGNDDWTHYAISFITEGNNVRTRLYTNGKETSNDALAAGASLGELSGKINANLGALLANPHGNDYHHVAPQQYQGWGRLSASLDEFRFWKIKRTSEEIEKNYFHPIGGGQNKKHPDEQLRNLGIYYKFNEGITTTDSTDSVVLDYSGRIANGEWTGYPGSTSRNTGSAMVSASVLTEEPHDPIIYSSHPDVVSLLSEMKTSGSLHDRVSGSFLYDSIPLWIREEDTDGKVKSLFQIISSYFDTLYSQIGELNNLQDKKYFNIDNSKFEVRPHSFAKTALQGQGLIVPEIFANTSVMEYFMQRDVSNVKFDEKIIDIKNMIYQNIYNNLDTIYKSKGTHESYRNLLRCFGIDDEILKLNMYTDKGTHYFRDNTRHTSVKKKYLDFNHTTRFESTVYQTASAPGGNTFISGSKTDLYEVNSSFTYELDVIAPFKLKQGQSGYFATSFVSSSIFGQHSAEDTASDYTWKSSGDDSEFRVYLVKDSKDPNSGYFQLTSSTLGIDLKSQTYYKIYDNERWNLAVRIKPIHFPFDGGFHHTTSPEYQVEFYGVNHVADVIKNEFNLSTTISNALGKAFVVSHKRVYVGAHRTNFTGAVLQSSDLQIGHARVWMDYLDNDVIKQHAMDPFNYGASKNANSNSTMFTVELSGTHIPRYDSLVLHWQLDTVTGSDSSGFLSIEDFSSGSSDNVYGWVDNIIREKHPAKGDFFPVSSTAPIANEFIYASRKQLPEVSVSYDRVFVKGDEEKYFIEDDDVSDNFYSLEKSFYANISEEILDTFSTVAELSNLMGKYQDRYKRNYSRMDHFRKLFFERVDGDLDFDQFTSYFKWIDSSISSIVRQLVPVSARISPDVSNLIEDHILERNKYDNKFPLLERESQDPKFGSMKGIRELTYNWKFGHAPLGVDDEKAMCINIDNQNSNSGNQCEFLETPNVNLKVLNPNIDEFTSKDITFSFWCHPTALPGSGQFLLMIDGNGSKIPLRVEINNNRTMVIRVRYNNQVVTWSHYGVTVPLDTWSHFVVTYNGSATNSGQTQDTVKFYLNGSVGTTKIGSTQSGTPDSFVGVKWVLGGLKASSNIDFSFSGKLDDLAIWETVLTPSEVSTLYNSSQPYDLSTIQPSNIVSWWRMGDHPDDVTSPFTVNNEIKPDISLKQAGNSGGITFDTATYSSTFLNLVNTSDRVNCLWWDERALRESDVSTNNASRDEQREKIRKISTYDVTSSSPQFAKTDNTIYSGSAYALRRFSTPYKLNVEKQNVIHAGTNYDIRKNRDIAHNAVHIHGPHSPQTGVPMNIILVGAEEDDGLVKEIPCNDVINPDLDSTGDSIIMKKKRRNSDIIIGREFEDEKFTYDRKLTGDMVLPFSIYSSSTENMKGVYENLRTSYANDIIITNVHSDTYGNKNDLGLQGPFSDTWVGGHQHRHVGLNKYDSSLVTFAVNPNNPSQIQTINSGDPGWTGLRDIHNRPEAWYIYHESVGILEDPLGTPEPDGIIGVVGPDYGFGYPSQVMFYAHRYRDERAKRPVNIRNIKTIRPQPDSTVVGAEGYVTSSNGVHRQSHPYFHSGASTTQIMTGSQKLGNFYSNYEVVQASGRSINNLFFRKSFGSEDVDKQESPILPEAMRSTTSEIYSGSALLPDATHYSALYGRRPTFIHNDGNLFLREPKFVGVGNADDVNYCVDMVNTPDSGLTVRRFFDNLHRINGTGQLTDFCFSMWFALSDVSNLSTNEYSILAQFGQGSSNKYSYEIHVAAKKTGDYVFRVVIGGASMGVYTTNSTGIGVDQWAHIVVEFITSKIGSSEIPVRLFLSGQELSLAEDQALAGWTAPYASTTRLCLSANTPSTERLDMSAFVMPSFSRFKGYLSDCFLLDIPGSSGLSETLIKRFYNRGFLCDPTLLTDREILFWFAMGRNDLDTLEGPVADSTSEVATYSAIELENVGGIKIFNLIDKTSNHSDMVLDQQGTGNTSEDNSTTTENSFATPAQVPSGKPVVADTSGYHWEYAFDKNPSLSGSNSDSVFVNRFSSPGGPEIMSRGFLDAASGEYSVYNCLPWRNLSVKGTKPRSSEGTSFVAPYIFPIGPFNGTNSVQAGIHVLDQHDEFDGLYARLSRHSGRYGTDPKKFIDSSIVGATTTQFETRVQSPSWHKQQRNIARRPQPSLGGFPASTLDAPVLRESFDNAYVNTPIPRSDFQYTWVTASLAQEYGVLSGKQNFYGYAPRSGEFKSSTEVTVNGTYHTITNQGYNTGYYIGQTDLASFYSETWTFSAWIKPDLDNLQLGRKSYLYTLYLNDPSGTSYYNEIYLEGKGSNTARLWLKVPNTSGTYGEWYFDLSSAYHNTWFHLSVAFDGTDPSCPSMFYINGVEVEDIANAAFTGTAMLTRTADILYIYDYDGGNTQSNIKNFIGSVDETVIHNKVLKQVDVTKIYNSGKAYDFDKRFAPRGLLAWWRFGDTRDFQGDTYANSDSFADESYVYDRSGQRNHLEVENSTFTQYITAESSSPFEEKKIQYRTMVEAIVFPSASEIIGV